MNPTYVKEWKIWKCKWSSKLVRCNNQLRLFFFFSYCRYNPLWVLTFSVIFFHSALSLHKFLQPLIAIICISSPMSSIHLFLGLPMFLLPVGFHSSTLLGILFPSIRITWPSQVILFLFKMYSIQLAVKTQLLYCTVCTMYKNYMFRPILAIFRFFV